MISLSSGPATPFYTRGNLHSEVQLKQDLNSTHSRLIMRLKILLMILVGASEFFVMLSSNRKQDIFRPQPIENKLTSASPSASVSEVISKYKWTLFLGNQSIDNSKYNPPKVFQADESKMDASRKDYFMSIDPDFRKNISRSVPIHCYSGEYGLFPKKYRKFIDLLIEYSHFHNNQTTATTKVLVWQCSRIGRCG